MAVIGPYERFLRLDSLTHATDLLRARAVYMLGWAFIITQCVNIILMTMTYGSWTFDHTIAIVVSGLVACIIHGLRYTKNFLLFAVFFTGLLFASVLAVSSQDTTGINTALLPMFVVGALFNGFIGGWRMVSVYFLLCVVLVIRLYNVSASAAPTDAALALIYEASIFQRASQVILAIVWVSAFSIFITETMNRTFSRLEDALQKVQVSEKDKMDFLSNLSHELRTPLNGVNGMTRLLLSTKLEPDQKKYATIVDKCSKRLSQIVVEALALSKLDTGKFVLKSETFNLKELLTGLMDVYRPAAVKKGIDFELTFAGQLPEYYVGDVKRLRQVFKNLVVNALKFTDEGAVKIAVDGRLKGRDSVALHMSVTDTGVGISSIDLGRIFKRFEQLETGLARKNSGTGLGLSLCKEIVAYMGGTVTADSEPGQGSQFYVDLVLPVGWPTEIETPGQMMQSKAQKRAA